ncbi:putative membrane protein [Caldalkalibacillus uzonensis]|uniref:Membrane protein n=1 Tax=Caldalkalibacillus uzonensis TaxID=353224 RepID=A0ABU0CNV3_9BACI|nr:putative membrane protein [Caldalkalibacillus uzonensis]
MNNRRGLRLLLITVLGVSLIGLGQMSALAQPALELFTPYPGVSVTPGESLNYEIEVINNGSGIQFVTFRIEGLADDWNYHLTADGRDIKRLSVRPGQSETVYLQVDVPLQIDKGEYEFRLVGSGSGNVRAVLPITVDVTEEGTYRTELTSEQPNMEGHADSNFTFKASLRNRTASEQLYSLSADAPRGWQVRFESGGQHVTSVNVDPNGVQDINIEVNPPEGITDGTYTIPITAATSGTKATLELEVVITGTYDLVVSTPSERLNFDITAGRSKTIELEVTNQGTADLRDISLEASAPVNWEVSFEPERIDVLPPGESARVRATVTADQNALAGDYVLNIDASAPEVSNSASFRATVKTPLLWGWIGILIIAGVIGGIGYLFKTYGRR